MPGFMPDIHILNALSIKRRGWPRQMSASDAVLRTAMPGHDDNIDHRIAQSVISIAQKRR
jgi:hypothetical protein